VLLVSNDANNRAASTVTILPITSSVSRVYPFEVLLQTEESGLPKLSKVQPQQTNSRFQAKLGNEANETNL
jgi:mRNA interferase MazF